MGRQGQHHVISLTANLLEHGYKLAPVSAERFYAHNISVAMTFPNICGPIGSERDISLLRDVI